jgi:outer membrane biosynthesis protein TonB
MATKIVEPVVSDSLLAAASDTVVLVQVALDESGKVTGTVPVRGDTLLFPAAEQAVRLWEFTPAIMDTAPVAVRIVVPVRFYPSRSN